MVMSTKQPSKNTTGGSPPGLGNESEREWPKVTQKDLEERPIDRLTPGSILHDKVLNYLMDRLEMSERKMNQFYPRWRVNERNVQAYVDLEEYEAILDADNKDGKPRKAVSMVFPYSFATIMTIVTYLMHTFAGRKPMFQLGSYRGDAAGAARNMELILQYNADHSRLIRHLYQFLLDGEIYGLGVLRTEWADKKARRTVWKNGQKFREERTVYQGNLAASVDPFMFFPDPRVPMVEVNRKGEFVFWRTFEGRHSLKRMEASGALRYVDAAPEQLRNRGNSMGGLNSGNSDRDILSEGDATPGMLRDEVRSGRSFYQTDQGSIEIIPAELGLSDSRVPEKWIFTVLNKGQIVQAEPLSHDHEMHPVAVQEPYSLGYGFGNAGILDYTRPLQDTLSWFIDSHMHNVKAAMNNMFIVDPSRVEMQDLKNPDPGKIIRLKRSSYGQDVRSAITQLNVTDVTKNHINDMQMMVRLADSMTAINDNLRGLQTDGGRKTATEVRTSGEAAASRLASHARLTSAQGVSDLTEQWTLNTQQFLDQEFEFQITGPEGQQDPIHLSPEMLTGDFYFPVHDGTLPLDRVALLDVWKEIFVAVQGDEELRQKYKLPKIFDFMAELGGAQNMESFKADLQSDASVQNGVNAGNLVPPGELPPGVL